MWFRLKPGFHISQLNSDLLSGIAEGENNFRNTKVKTTGTSPMTIRPKGHRQKLFCLPFISFSQL